MTDTTHDTFDDTTAAWLDELGAELGASDWDLGAARADDIARSARETLAEAANRRPMWARLRQRLEPAMAYAVGASYLAWAVGQVFLH